MKSFLAVGKFPFERPLLKRRFPRKKVSSQGTGDQGGLKGGGVNMTGTGISRKPGPAFRPAFRPAFCQAFRTDPRRK
jgi:hypothetical protein